MNRRTQPSGARPRSHASGDTPSRTGFRIPAIAIFAVALAVRLIYLWQIRESPFFTTLMGDARGYDAWARQIAAGDWIGRDVFYQAPLYPYFLGVLYTIAGRSLLIVRVCQIVIGSAACVLLALTGRRLFGDRVGIAAGVMLALYAPAIFFDGLLQKTVLDVFFVTLSLWLLSRILVERATSWDWLWLGLAMGALNLTRENALALAAVVAGWAAVDGAQKSPLRARLRHVAAFACGLAVLVGPVAIRNTIVGGEFHLTTSQFGPNFYMGNNAHTDGTASSLRSGRGSPEYERQDATELAELATGRQLTPGEVSAYWTGQALAFIRAQPAAWAKLMVRKFALVWNRTEWLDTEAQESYAEWSPVLRVGAWVGHFGVLVPLACVGVCLTWRKRRTLVVLYAMIAVYAATVAAFYIYARYRFPLVPFLILFAAAGLVAIPGLVRGAVRDAIGRRELAIAAFAAVLTAIFCNWRMLPTNLMRAITETNLGAALQDEARVDEAADHFRRAASIRPDYAPAYNNLGVALAAQGRVRDAIPAYERAAAIAPDYPDPHYNLANALMREGDASKAVDQFRLALQLAPASADVYNNLGVALASAGRVDEAVDAFQRALQLDPRSTKTQRNLADALAAAGRGDEGLEQLRRAVRQDPRDAEAQYDLGTALLQAGRYQEAADAFRAALAVDPDNADAHNNFGSALGSLGRLDEAAEQFQLAIKLRPGFPDAERNLSMAREAQRRGAR